LGRTRRKRIAPRTHINQSIKDLIYTNPQPPQSPGIEECNTVYARARVNPEQVTLDVLQHIASIASGDAIHAILVAPRFKNILRLEAGYPALRCHNLKQSTGHTHTHTTHTTKTKTTQNSKTAKHSHTHKTHSRSRNDERQRLSSCCQSCR